MCSSDLDAQGEHEKAEQYFQQAIESLEKSLGKYHPHTENSIRNLFRSYLARGKRQEAIALQKKYPIIISADLVKPEEPQDAETKE